jgi:hypothetical protein
MRNIGKLVSLALLVVVTPLLSTCDKAEPTPPKSHVSPTYGSPNEAWSRLLRTLWPTLYVRAEPGAKSTTATGADATDASAAKPDYVNGPKDEHDAAGAGKGRDVESERSGERRGPRAEHHPAATRHHREAVPHGRARAQHRKAREPKIGGRGRTAVLDVQHSRASAAPVAEIADRGIGVPDGESPICGRHASGLSIAARSSLAS